MRIISTQLLLVGIRIHFPRQDTSQYVWSNMIGRTLTYVCVYKNITSEYPGYLQIGYRASDLD